MSAPRGSTPIGRPRSEEASSAILEATLTLLGQKGFGGLRVDEIAELAGVSKATIYRRWPSKVELAADAFAELPDLPEPAHGDLVEDLTELVMQLLELFDKAPLAAVLPAFAAARAQNPELSAMLAPAIRDKRRAFFTVLRRGMEAGELPSTLNLDITVDLLLGPSLTRVLVSGDVVDERYVRETVRTVIAGVVAAAEER
jgi:AcrR family transcriptional regulator